MEMSNRVKLQYALTFVADALALLCSTVAAWVLFGPGLHLILPYSTADQMQFVLILVVAFLCTFFCFNQAENITRRPWQRELLLALRFSVVLAAAMAVLMLVTKAAMLDSRYLFVGIPLCNVAAMLGSHQLLKAYLCRAGNRGVLTRLVGVISTADRAPALLADLKKDWTKAVSGMALLDAPTSDIGKKIDGITLEANYDNFIDWIRRDALDEIYIDLPMDSGASLLPCLQELESMGVDIHLNVPMLEKLRPDGRWPEHLCPTIEQRGGVPLITLSANKRTMTDLVLKRSMDILGGLVGCLFSIPIIAVTAIPLKLESPGPLMFKQKRVGLNGRVFYIYKLRSMYQDAEARKQELMEKNEMDGLMFKMTQDPRITKVGRFIRRTSIDELPQFFNVLKGEMSLVGTRPPTLDEYQQYKSHHKRRLSMKPGITGMWQVSGRSDIDCFEEVVKLDVTYIDNWSLGLDIRILAKTVVVVLCGRGAK